jgi:hypothetical protein
VTASRLPGPGFHRRPSTVAPLTEREWQHQVTDLARLRQWWLYHPLLSKWSEPGWPDLTLIRGPRMILAELKTDRGKITPAQERVLELLAPVQGVECYVWRPRDFDHVKDTLW